MNASQAHRLEILNHQLAASDHGQRRAIGFCQRADNDQIWSSKIKPCGRSGAIQAVGRGMRRVFAQNSESLRIVDDEQPAKLPDNPRVIEQGRRLAGEREKPVSHDNRPEARPFYKYH